MKMTFRQIPCMTGVVTAVYSVPPGEVWPQEEIDKLKAMVLDKGLEMEVIESVPVHEDIKLGRGDVDKLLDVYCENIRRCAKYGVNIKDITQSVIEDYFAMIMLVEIDNMSSTFMSFQKELERVGQEKNHWKR